MREVFLDLVKWFNDHSPLITAAATIFIAWFAYVSSRILRWEKEKERRSRQPVLALIDEIAVDHRNLYVENVGYGPAMNVVRTVLQTDSLTEHTATKVPMPLRPLGQGQRAYAYCATLQGRVAAPMIDEPKFRVRIEYDDVSGNHYETLYENREHKTQQIQRRQTPAPQAERV